MKGLLAAVLTTLIITVVSPMFAESWEVAVDANLTITQNAYSDNWAGGETGAISWISGANFLVEKQFNTKIHNKNTLKLAFGQTYSQDKDTKEWSAPVKSTDLIDLESILRLTLGGFVDPFAAGRVETQFYDDSDLNNDRIINPVHFTESAGMAKAFIKEEKQELTVRLGIGLRQHLDRDALPDSTPPYVVPVAETKITNDGGLICVVDFTTPLAQEKITFASKFSVFKALFYSESNALVGLPHEDYWKSPDVNWENTFTANITSYLMVNLYAQLLYDKEVDTGMRFKENLSLGLTFKLI